MIFAGLAALSLLAWGYLVWLAIGQPAAQMAAMPDMSGMPEMDAMSGMMQMAGPRPGAWHAADFAFAFAMWTVMMVAMMTPAAAPMILLYARVGREAAAQQKPYAATAWFAAGYLLAWTALSLLAVALQWALVRAALLTPMLAAATDGFAGAVLIVAGLYQLTSFKNACLSRCRSPFSFLLQHGGFRGEAGGALALGLRHGLYCVGCCWALMALLFVAGVMNLLWIAALTLLVLLEKLGPRGELVARVSGLVLLASGSIFLAKQAVSAVM